MPEAFKEVSEALHAYSITKAVQGYCGKYYFKPTDKVIWYNLLAMFAPFFV
jgi:hypothetical protein